MSKLAKGDHVLINPESLPWAEVQTLQQGYGGCTGEMSDQFGKTGVIIQDKAARGSLLVETVGPGESFHWNPALLRRAGVSWPETDPTGKSASEAGSKLDAGKPRLDLVLGAFADALNAVGQVGTFGANKYTDNGWQKVDNGAERYASAMLRHYFKYKAGEAVDPDSGLPHLAHLAWNALALFELNKESLPNDSK